MAGAPRACKAVSHCRGSALAVSDLTLGHPVGVLLEAAVFSEAAVVVRAVEQGLVRDWVLQVRAERQGEEQGPHPLWASGSPRRTGCQSRRPLRVG